MLVSPQCCLFKNLQGQKPDQEAVHKQKTPRSFDMMRVENLKLPGASCGAVERETRLTFCTLDSLQLVS